MNRKKVIELLRRADAVCFDVDSTVCVGEGIDELAEFCGKGREVAEMTSKAMNGNMDFRDALQTRLGIIQPSSHQIQELILRKPPQLTPNIENLISLLKYHNKTPYLVSGGFDCLINPVAERLGIPLENVFANKLKFYYDGTYAGFDGDQPTSRSGGKSTVIEILRSRHTTIVMIGDGITDLEACPPADGFIGFGGNVVREAVRIRAPWYVMDFQEIINVLN